MMELKKIDYKLTVCKVAEVSSIDMRSDFYFIGKTDEELSLVCKTEDTPDNTIERDDGWRGFCIQGVLDFSLIGIRQNCPASSLSIKLAYLPYRLITPTIFS
jgi:hypothetical protein